MPSESPPVEQVSPSPFASDDRIYDDGRLITDDGIGIFTYFVNLQSAPEFRWPREMPTVVKGSPSRYAIGNCNTLLLSKPEVFRRSGETLISDLTEGITSSEDVVIDDASDLDRSAVIDDEMSRAASSLGIAQQRETATTRKADSRTQVFGKNCWIWCAAILPETPAEHETWISSLGDDYDSVTAILSPRMFARVLGSAVATQFGPQGSPVSWRHPYGKLLTEHPSQYVFHGPVAYVDDPYSYVTQSGNGFERTLRAAFFKHSSYVEQREYRFVVWSDQEPDQLTLLVQVTPEILAWAQRYDGDDDSRQEGATLSSSPAIAHQGRNASAAISGSDEYAAGAFSGVPTDFTNTSFESSQPIRAFETTNEESHVTRQVNINSEFVVPAHTCVRQSSNIRSVAVERKMYPQLHDMVVARSIDVGASARDARVAPLSYFLHGLWDAEGGSPESSASMFHAQRLVIELVLTYVDPIAHISLDGDTVVIQIKVDAGDDKAAKIAVSPSGTVQYILRNGDRHEHVTCENALVASQVLLEGLRPLGLQSCMELMRNGLLPRLPSVLLPSAACPDRLIRHSAQAHTIVHEVLTGIDTPAGDAANDQEESGPDDARITRLVIDGGPGAVYKIHGIRAGISGTFSQITRQDRLTVHVGTMNPDATVRIDPPDSAPDDDGHVVTLPDSEHTLITITATSPDGTAQSQIKCIAQRDAGEVRGGI